MKRLFILLLLITGLFSQYTNIPVRSNLSPIIVSSDMNQQMENIRYLGGYITNIYADLTIPVSDPSGLYAVWNYGTNINVYLPKAESNVARRIIVYKADSGASNVEVYTTGAATIGGSTNISLTSFGYYIGVFSDGTNWQEFSRGPVSALASFSITGAPTNDSIVRFDVGSVTNLQSSDLKINDSGQLYSASGDFEIVDNIKIIDANPSIYFDQTGTDKYTLTASSSGGGNMFLYSTSEGIDYYRLYGSNFIFNPASSDIDFQIGSNLFLNAGENKFYYFGGVDAGGQIQTNYPAATFSNAPVILYQLEQSTNGLPEKIDGVSNYVIADYVPFSGGTMDSGSYISNLSSLESEDISIASSGNSTLNFYSSDQNKWDIGLLGGDIFQIYHPSNGTLHTFSSSVFTFNSGEDDVDFDILKNGGGDAFSYDAGNDLFTFGSPVNGGGQIFTNISILEVSNNYANYINLDGDANDAYLDIKNNKSGGDSLVRFYHTNKMQHTLGYGLTGDGIFSLTDNSNSYVWFDDGLKMTIARPLLVTSTLDMQGNIATNFPTSTFSNAPATVDYVQTEVSGKYQYTIAHPEATNFTPPSQAGFFTLTYISDADGTTSVLGNGMFSYDVDGSPSFDSVWNGSSLNYSNNILLTDGTGAASKITVATSSNKISIANRLGFPINMRFTFFGGNSDL